MKEFKEPRELLPEWGPYSKKYMGVSRAVPDADASGVRFDCVVHPAEANMNQPVPNVTFPSAWHMWEAAPDLSYYSYRVELEWRDRLYVDVSFVKLDDAATLIRTEYKNDTDLSRNCVLNYYFSIEYPRRRIAEARSDGKYAIKKFTEYDSMEYRTPRPWEHLMPNGLHRGEFFDDDFTDGRGFGERAPMPEYVPRTRFGEEAGDTVTLTLRSDAAFDTLTLRYKTTSDTPARFALTVGEAEIVVTLPPASVLTLFSLPIAPVTGELRLTLTSLGGGGAEFDFAALSGSKDPVYVTVRAPEYIPVCRPDSNGYTLTYKGTPHTFGFSPMTESVRTRMIPSGALEDALPSRLSQADPSFDRVLRTFTHSFSDKHSDDGFYQNFIVHSIFIPPYSSHIEYAVVSDGEPMAITREEAERAYEQRKGALSGMRFSRSGERYAQSCRMLESALLTNIVYPIYRHGEWIKHHTPGKRWDSLYTWDSGFIGLGLLEVDRRLAEYVLTLYLSREDNPDFAFLLHGSPVPVQAYLYLELLQRTKDKTALYALYPRVRRYYRYLAGKAEGSVTDPFRSGLTTTFAYFYNCSGMDDLPPQVAMHESGKEFDCAPALTTSHLIRMAKMLRMIACEAGFDGDIAEYDSDIARRSEAFLRYAWDEDSGYFGYVVHDKDKNPIGVYKTADGENLSRGMDGVYPLVAGICDGEREVRLLGHIFSEREMFSPVGISAVDMSASYYRDNGYWNGNVWFSHQWFLWKTMLDLGLGDNAYRIAKCALDAWAREVDHSYYTFEMLNIKTGRGGWFHHFGGLSSPVLVWACAYYRPGTVSCGFDMWLALQSYDAAADKVSLTVTDHGGRGGILIAVLAKSEGAAAFLDGTAIPLTVRTDGAVEAAVPAGVKNGALIIKGGGR